MQLTKIDNNREFDFGRTSADYARFRDIYPKSMYDKLIGFGIGKKGQSILDLGSGTAVLPINLYHTGAVFTATDIAENQIISGRQLAAEKGMDDIRFKVCSAEDTGFADNSFDVVTAVQCFPYFDTDRAIPEIIRVLKPHGLFCTVIMDWLPDEDNVIAEMIALVKKFNPSWTPDSFKKDAYTVPTWAKGKFETVKADIEDADIIFTKEAWLGRVLTCRGVGASLPPEKVRGFETAYRALLDKYDEPLKLRHQIQIEVYRALQRR